jgi:predicted ATP-grasp superfamily ATP-dependent carboligase
VSSNQRLIILGSSLTALAVARDAHALGMEPVVVDTRRGIAFHSRWVRPVVLPQGAVDSQLMQHVLTSGSERDYLIATSDAWLKFVVAHRKTLDDACRAVLHPSNSALEICLDKSKFAAWCLSQGIPSPRTWRVGHEPRPAGLLPPLLVRPASTLHGGAAASAKTVLPKAIEARSEAELDEWLSAFAEQQRAAVVSESLLHQPLTQFSVPFVRAPDNLEVFVARKLRPAPKHCSVGSYVELAPQRDVEHLARRAVEALDYFGIGEAEILRVDSTGQLFLIEINARPWIQYALAPASGHDFLGILVGRPRSMRRVTNGRRWVNLETDLFGAFSSSMGAVRRGELGLGSYLMSLIRANVYARFNLSDPMPAFRRSDR